MLSPSLARQNRKMRKKEKEFGVFVFRLRFFVLFEREPVAVAFVLRGRSILFFFSRQREAFVEQKKERRRRSLPLSLFSSSPLRPAMASTAQDSSAPLRTEKKDEDVDESTYRTGKRGARLHFKRAFFYVDRAITQIRSFPLPSRSSPGAPIERVECLAREVPLRHRLGTFRSKAWSSSGRATRTERKRRQRKRKNAMGFFPVLLSLFEPPFSYVQLLFSLEFVFRDRNRGMQLLFVFAGTEEKEFSKRKRGR